MVDSGGQYNYGTTDVTRTISLDNNNQRIKNIFTRVLKGHIAVASYKLKNDTTGSKIDKVARKKTFARILIWTIQTRYRSRCWLFS